MTGRGPRRDARRAAATGRLVGVLDHTEYERWRRSAERAREVATANARDAFHQWACFLCEQSAQLALKGLLHGVGAGGIARGHDLARLADAVEADLEVEVPAAVRAGLRRLARTYTAARYPDALADGTADEAFGREDAEQSLADAAAVLALVGTAWAALVEAEAADERNEGDA